MKRTHLPLNALRVFDAAARHLSFTKAADELAVTPAAVGQQIRALEDVLGVVLFRRMTRNLELTPEAERALPSLRAGFLEFEEAVRLMQEAQGSKSLTLAAPRDFTAKWLAPRLAAFGVEHPDVRFVIVAADDGVDFTQANLDLALVFGPAPQEEGIHGKPLAAETLVTVAAPGVAADSCHIRYPGDAMPLEGCSTLTVADAGLALDAAAAGLGRARIPATLAAADIAAGKLVTHGSPEPIDSAYWLLAPTPQWRQAKVKALVEFLLT
jgi:LysR family transcriptional regulator, glycine cleavage system transcriptional activator